MVVLMVLRGHLPAVLLKKPGGNMSELGDFNIVKPELTNWFVKQIIGHKTIGKK